MFIKINNDCYLSYVVSDRMSEDSFIDTLTFFYRSGYNGVQEIIDELNDARLDFSDDDANNLNTIILTQWGLEIEPVTTSFDLDGVDEYYNAETFKSINKVIKSIKKSDRGLSVIYGERGMGKTSIINYLSSKLDRIVIFIPNNMIDHTINNPEFRKFLKRYDKPILIIEVGNLLRGETWRISEGHIHGFGFFGNDQDLDLTRPQKLGVNLKSLGGQRRGEILIATQHNKSLQWAGQPSMEQWVRDIIRKIKSHSNRRIVVRPHPRALLREKFVDAVIELPRKIDGTYDSFDINYNYHCVINHNSGPAIQAAINGTPVICDSSSLAFPISEKWENLENPQLPQREDWFLKLCHTEWTVEELRLGTPIKRLTAHLEEKLKIIS